VLFVVTYVLSGIGDRYFVVPQMLAFIVVAVYTAQHFEGTKFILRAALAVSIAIFCRASVKWYDAGWFLSDGPKWSEQVDLARSRCEVDSTQIIQLEQALGNTELPCSAILARS
jgi:hypothetical protein